MNNASRRLECSLGQSAWRIAAAVSFLALSACVGDQPVVGGGPGTPSTPPPVTGTLPTNPTLAPGRPSEKDPVIAAAGDIACKLTTQDPTSCEQQATAELLAAGGYDWILTLGDIAYEDGTFNEFRTNFHPTWGMFKGRIRPAPGNHEYQTIGALGYFRYFGKMAGPRGKGYYSLDIGKWHIVALNSNCGDVSCAEDSDQVRWLRRDLAAHRNTCTLAFWHHPRWSSGTTHGSNDDVAAFVGALHEFGAEIILVGHEHNYERFAPQDPGGRKDVDRGIRQIVVGTGGADHHPLGPPISNSQVRNAETFGVLELVLHPRSYEWRFVPLTDRTFTDSGRTNCH